VRLARPPISSGRSSNRFSEISRQANFFRLPISYTLKAIICNNSRIKQFCCKSSGSVQTGTDHVGQVGLG
jgi:hypothetical protein